MLDQDYHTPQDDVEVMERKGRVSTFLEGKLSRKVTGGCNCFLESKGKCKFPHPPPGEIGANLQHLITGFRESRKPSTQCLDCYPWMQPRTQKGDLDLMTMTQVLFTETTSLLHPSFPISSRWLHQLTEANANVTK